MSNASHIFNHYILANEPVTLQFYSEADINSFMNLLRGCKFRYVSNLKKLGMEDANLLEDKSIQHTKELLPDGSYKVKIYSDTPKKAVSSIQFNILED